MACRLLVDDESIRPLVLDYLQGFGTHVKTIADGAGLRNRLPRGGIDLMLPDENGLACVNEAS